MKPSRRWPSIFLDLILFSGLVFIWIAFAPVKIGGKASYVIVNGNSMEPDYHTGDLVIVHKSQTYQVGDVITYRDAEMGAHVIHRIIGIDEGQFVIKGDNNSWIDTYRPTQDEIIGKQWVYVPKLGRTMQWLRAPINLSVTVLLLGGVLMSNMIVKRPKGQKGKARPTPHLGGMLEGAVYLLGLLFLGFLALSIFSFTRPLTRAGDSIPYQQESNYFYSATATPGIYDTEMVRTGEPVFPSLTCFLNIGFTYNLLGNQFQNITGSHQMFALIMDEQSGWQRTLPLIPQTAFAGNSYFAISSLDLCQLVTLVDSVEEQTGLRASGYTVQIISNIAFKSEVSGQLIQDTFDPTLAFKFDQVHIHLTDTNQETDPLHSTKQGLISSSTMEANTLPLLGWEPRVGSIRVFALLGLGLSLGGLFLIGFFVFNTARQNEEARIRLRYGSLLMDVYQRSLDAALLVIEVTSIDDLAKMAERQNTMIQHMTVNFIHYYLVQSNGAIYRYVLSGEQKRIPERQPASQKIIEYAANDNQYIYNRPQSVPDEVTEYVITPDSILATKVRLEETVFLRKIKI